HAAEAQHPGKVYRIGFLGLGSAADMVISIEPLRQGLRELGYIEGRNLTLEYRGAEGRLEHLADLAVELVRLPVDLIVTYAVGVRAAKHATTTLPIVVLSVGGDLVEAGRVATRAATGWEHNGIVLLWAGAAGEASGAAQGGFSRRHPGGRSPARSQSL